jgi:hypothetical protein
MISKNQILRLAFTLSGTGIVVDMLLNLPKMPSNGLVLQ